MITKKQKQELERIAQEVRDLKKHSVVGPMGKVRGDNEVIHYEYDRLVNEALILLGGEVIHKALEDLEKEVNFTFWYA